ncbi:MAG: TetR/AcrR family transcriptional regulator [Lachnospiraceae bacterium]|nr:TetR/AcrR family transcriptional regulator [Lachnospiraceae bacterium]
MPSKVFQELDKEKQNRVIEASIREFAEHGYAGGTTNRIIKECGISKGSLFKYFENKEELYFYLIDLVTEQREKEMKGEIEELSKDLFKRTIGYAVAEFSWHASHPVRGKFLMAVAAETDPEICAKIAERYGGKSEDVFRELMKGVDMSDFRNEREEIINMLKWVMAGFNNSFLQSMAGRTEDPASLQKEYVKQLKTYLKMLKKGL